MSPFKSGTLQIWPILCKPFCADYDIYKPFLVGIVSSHGKPSFQLTNQFFVPFIEEINDLLSNGFMIGYTKYDIIIKCFCCDIPARAFLKCIKGHGGYSACERCTVVGELEERRVYYTSDIESKRTDESFRNKEDINHHNIRETSQFIKIKPELDMINIFVLDSMHLFFCQE